MQQLVQHHPRQLEGTVDKQFYEEQDRVFYPALSRLSDC